MSSVPGRVALGLLAFAIAVQSSNAFAGDTPAGSAAERRVQDVVASVRARLTLSAPVVVTIHSAHSLMMSVTPPESAAAPFTLDVDAAFLETLTDGEMEAAVAHELGHVWVFTHHPYLQTEELANQIAMRVVTRENLERVYEKMWKQTGTKGNLSEFLGTEARTASTP